MQSHIGSSTYWDLYNRASRDRGLGNSIRRRIIGISRSYGHVREPVDGFIANDTRDRMATGVVTWYLR